MKHWWVNNKQTYAHEVGGGYLWSPKKKRNGARNRFYDSMTEAMVGDVVFAFAHNQIKAVGLVAESCHSAEKPNVFGQAGKAWRDEGWFLPVDFIKLAKPLRPKDFMDVIGPVLPQKYSPIQQNGNGNQVVYLAEISDELGAILRALLGGQVEAIEAQLPGRINEKSDDEEEARIQSDESISDTEREQLVKARVGQGLFRSRVRFVEPRCRITGVDDPRFLRASHIKPWRLSTSAEKLDGNNGLMLSPHVDHLFDAGFISFEDDGSLLLSPVLPAEVVNAWSLINIVVPASSFTKAQMAYLGFHRIEIFRSSRERPQSGADQSVRGHLERAEHVINEY